MSDDEYYVVVVAVESGISIAELFESFRSCFEGDVRCASGKLQETRNHQMLHLDAEVTDEIRFLIIS